jgi:exodeoxyribonuclease VII large subunit
MPKMIEPLNLDKQTRPQEQMDSRTRPMIFTVSELNGNIKSLLEDRFPFIWLTGEISNLRVPASAHCYFTLKDQSSQISAVMFRGQHRNLKFEPEDGMSVTGLGRISVYEPRGTYQIILEYLEPSGIGALQVAFERLKMRLAAEGFFDPQHKKPLTFLPQKISIITSPSGSVIHDILSIIDRRFPNVAIQIIPAKVQGDGAVEEIVAAIENLNFRNDTDVAIVARGGGSLEDLQAFNSEPVARAIFASKIPIVSAVGHETDYTIADFVADLRAPTPSAAAAMIVPEKSELLRRCSQLDTLLKAAILKHIKILKLKLLQASHRLVHPKRKIEDFRLKLDDWSARLNRILAYRIDREHERLNFWANRLNANRPSALLQKYKQRIEKNYKNILNLFIIYIELRKAKTRELAAKLDTLSPIAVLQRGYSITRTIPEANVVKDPKGVALNQDLEVLVAKGRLFCRVKGKEVHAAKDI